MWRELKGLELNRCVASWTPLISEANQRKGLWFAREHNDWTLECCYPVAEWWADQGQKRGGWGDTPSCLAHIVQACGGSVTTFGGFSWSGLGSAMICVQKTRSAHDNITIHQGQICPLTVILWLLWLRATSEWHICIINWLKTTALLLLVVLAQMCLRWPIRRRCVIGRRGPKETVTKETEGGN